MNSNHSLLLKVLIVIGICFITYAKILLISFESSDYLDYLRVWCTAIVKDGYLYAFKTKFSNYPPLYLYFLVLIAKLFNTSMWLPAIKFLSILFDFLLGYFGYKIILQATRDRPWAILGGGLLFSLPTVVLNSAMWGQCDSIYGSLVVGASYFFLTKRHVWAFVLLGISFSLKLQTVFIFPIIALLYFSNQGIRIWHFLIIPAIFVLTIVPAWLFGGDFEDLLRTYLDQSDQYRILSMNAPNIFAFLPNLYFTFKLVGILFTAMVVVTILFLHFYRPLLLNEETIVAFCFLFTAIVPYFLPSMHERYFFLADLFSLIYCFCRKDKFYYAILMQVISFFSYIPYLLRYQAFEFKYISLLFAVVLYFLFKEVFKPTFQAIRKES
jgi:Gpi18-like mannosyltransferase